MAGQELAKQEATPTLPPAVVQLNALKDTLIENHRIRYPFVFAPAYKVKVGGTMVELWVSSRRMPLLFWADACVVPAAPDLKVVVGAAKIARDYGADIIQQEANAYVKLNGPMAPGDAFVGSGGKYHFKYTALAVIFDGYKRTSPAVIRQAYRQALELAFQRGARTAILPDITENTQAQPNWITSEQKARDAEAAAITLTETVRACAGVMNTLKIWVYDPDNAPIYRRELERLEQG